MTDHLRILWLTPDKPENISVGRSRIARHLQKFGYGVTVRGTTPSTLLDSLRERGAYDVVVGTTRAGALGGLLVSTVHCVPLVVDHIDPISQFHETHPAWLATPVAIAERIAFARSAVTLYVYEKERRRVGRHAPVARKTALGVDYERFADPDEEVLAAGRDILPESLDPPIAVYVGGLEPIYNVEAMLEAGAGLESGSLVVAGAGSLKEVVERTVARNDRVHYVGMIPHETVPGVLAACDVGLSLVDDPHTLKILEYGAAGLPVVQLDGRARDRFDTRVTYTSADPDAVRRAIHTAADSDSDPLHSFVASSDWGEIAETYADAIERAR